MAWFRCIPWRTEEREHSDRARSCLRWLGGWKEGEEEEGEGKEGGLNPRVNDAYAKNCATCIPPTHRPTRIWRPPLLRQQPPSAFGPTAEGAEPFPLRAQADAFGRDMAAAFIAVQNAKKRRNADGIDESEEGSDPGLLSPKAAPPMIIADPMPKLPNRPLEEILPHQFAVYAFYRKDFIQVPIAFVIAANFLVTILEKEIDPFRIQKYPNVWLVLDYVFNSIFILELMLNLYGSWFFEFWKSGWNVFDFIVVLSGVLTMAQVAALKQLKMLRAFRIFRLFKRIRSLNKIVTALLKAIPGVANAFVIMLIVSRCLCLRRCAQSV